MKKYISRLLCLFVFFPIYSDSTIADETSDFVDIHKTCQIDYQKCLILLPELLTYSIKHSRLWYTYKLYQFDALFSLERFSELEKELLPYIDDDELPLRFKVSVFVYYGKCINSKENNSLAVMYFNKAKDILLAVNTEWPDPLELVKVANIFNAMHEYHLGYEMLLNVESRFKRRKDVHFKYALYSNLGHFAFALNHHNKHIDYRLKAFKWSQVTGNINDQVIATFNVARAFFFVNQDDQAIKFFKKVIPLAQQAGNFSAIEKTHINLADLYFRQNKIEMARKSLSLVTHEKLNSTYSKRYQKLKVQLN